MINKFWCLSGKDLSTAFWITRQFVDLVMYFCSLGEMIQILVGNFETISYVKKKGIINLDVAFDDVCLFILLPKKKKIPFSSQQ